MIIPTHLTIKIMLAHFTFFTDFYKIVAFSKAHFSQNMLTPKLLLIDNVRHSPGVPHEYSDLSQKSEGGGRKKKSI